MISYAYRCLKTPWARPRSDCQNKGIQSRVSIFKQCIFKLRVAVLSVCAFRHHLFAWCLQSAEKGAAGVTNGCEPPCGRWDLNPVALQEQN